MKMLVTGFTPFGGEQINPSWEAARRLPNRIGGAELIKHEIPTEFDASGAALHKLLTELRPDAVLCVGQYGGFSIIRACQGNSIYKNDGGNGEQFHIPCFVGAGRIANGSIGRTEPGTGYAGAYKRLDHGLGTHHGSKLRYFRSGKTHFFDQSDVGCRTVAFLDVQ